MSTLEPARHHKPDAEEPSWRLLFVAGWGRSGSTLLCRMLAGAPGIVTVGELRDLVEYGVVRNRRCGCGAAFHECPFWSEVGRRAYGGWEHVDAARLQRIRRRLDRPWWTPLLHGIPLPLGVREDLRLYSAHLRRVYSAIAATTSARILVDSSKIASYALLLQRALPGRVRLVHLVRDPRAVLHSWQKIAQRGDTESALMIRYGVLAGSARYAFYNTAVTATPALANAALRLRYEDLVAAPRSAVREVLSHAGEPELATHFAGADRTVALGVDHTLDGNPMRFRHGATTIRLDDRWRAEMPRRKRAAVSILLRPWMAAYNYPTRTAPVVYIDEPSLADPQVRAEA